MRFAKLVRLDNVVLVVLGTLVFLVDSYTRAPGVILAWIPIAAAIGGAMVGGYFSNRAADKASDATQEANNINAEMARRNIQQQREFAQHGIRWKVEDAKAAGLHPLAALGANTHSFAPVSVGAVPDTAHADAMASFGRDLGQGLERGINATRTQPERQQAMAALGQKNMELQVEHNQLQNDYLRSKIALMNSAPNPPLPSNSDMPLLTGQGNSYKTGGYVTEVPSEVTHAAPGHPSQQVGKVTDLGWAQTKTGLVPVPSKDVKERIEDQLIPETMWAIRNQVLPNVSGAVDKPPKHLLPKGYDDWEWSYLRQEYQPVKGFKPWVQRYK